MNKKLLTWILVLTFIHAVFAIYISSTINRGYVSSGNVPKDCADCIDGYWKVGFPFVAFNKLSGGFSGFGIMPTMGMAYNFLIYFAIFFAVFYYFSRHIIIKETVKNPEENKPAHSQ